MRKVFAVAFVASVATWGYVPSASATIHPLVESADCASAQAGAVHPLGDVADPPGQTPGENHSEQSSLRAVRVISDDFTDLSSPALFGHKLDGECGHAGP